MSGYLKRMAASVVRPAGAIHPVVTGLFAKEARPEPGEVEMLVESARPSGRTIGSRAQELHPVEAVRERTLPVNSDAESASSRPTDSETDATKQDEAVTLREPLVPEWKRAAMPEHREQAAKEVSSDAHRVREERGESSGEVAEPRERGAEIETRILVPSAKRAEEAAPEDATTSPGNDYPRTPARVGVVEGRREAAAQRRAKGDETRRGTEDIQIHIGRIEVIAVPQPTQRPTPARAQHGETLEAYLKRHDRRSR